MKYPMFKVHINTDDALKQLEPVLNSGFVNEGEQVTELTNYFKNWFNHEQTIALNSCTSALTLALKLSDVGPGDEVIATSMTCVASNTPIHTFGANVVWADIDHGTGNVNPDKIEELITPKTKALLCVNWSGLPCDLERIYDICEKNNIKFIQDAAHSIGAEYNGKQVHHFAHYTCYSLQAIKHITTGDGGLLVVNTDEKEFQRAKALKWFGIDRDATKDEKGEWKGQRWEMDVVEAGFKFHMNNITAAIGLSQIPYINNIIDSITANQTGSSSELRILQDRISALEEENKRSAEAIKEISSYLSQMTIIVTTLAAEFAAVSEALHAQNEKDDTIFVSKQRIMPSQFEKLENY